MVAEPVSTEWRTVGPTLEGSKIGARRALLVMTVSMAVGLVAPLSWWQLVAILVGSGALLSLAFDLVRLKRGVVLQQRLQFDDRRVERVFRQGPTGKESKEVVAYDALASVEVSHGVVALHPIGVEGTRYLMLEDFADDTMILKMLSWMSSKEIPIMVSDDVPLLKAEWSRTHKTGGQ